MTVYFFIACLSFFLYSVSFSDLALLLRLFASIASILLKPFGHLFEDFGCFKSLLRKVNAD